MVWRSATDTLRASAESIIWITSRLFYESFQRFIKDTCEYAIRHAQANFKSKVEEFLTPLRETFGDWDPGEERIRSGRHPRPRTLKPAQASPSPSAMEFVRVALQILLRAKPPVALRVNALEWHSVDDFRKFVNETAQWAEFLDFGNLLAGLSNQSACDSLHSFRLLESALSHECYALFPV
jgi:hypothetical protein